MKIQPMMKRPVIFFSSLWLALCLVLSSCSTEPETADADLIISQAHIWTGNPAQPYAEALAVGGDTLIAVGSTDEVMAFKGTGTQMINASGQFISPGFIDCHVHFLTGGFNLSSVQLRDARTQEEFIQRIAEFASKQEPGTWILGGDWDHENWGGELPERSWIDEYTQENPVWINRLDGHMALANTAALEAAGIDRDVADVEGGTIVRDARGELTGIFKDNAMGLVGSKVPDPTDAQQDQALQAAMNYVASHGVTSVHDMVDDPDVFYRARERDELITRIYLMNPLPRWEELKTYIDQNGKGDKWIRRGGLKGFVDGSLGSHTAAFFEPFADAPNDSGFFVNTEEDLYTWISGADQADLHVMVHAIGDRANHTILDIFYRVAQENGSKDRRFRIEHAQHIAPQDFVRFADQQVIASMQPYHAIDDGRWAEKVIGPDRIQTTYAFRSLLDAGATVAFGSDWFVAPPIPLEGIYAAVTRRTLDGENPGGWVPNQKITVEEALAAYTRDAAYASFEEDIKGTLEPGKLADFVIIDRDLTAIDPVEIRNAKVVMTFVGGKVVYTPQP